MATEAEKAAKAAEKEAEKAAKADKTSATVVWRGNRTRTYTKELHGENFAALAKEFAEKKGGEVK